MGNRSLNWTSYSQVQILLSQNDIHEMRSATLGPCEQLPWALHPELHCDGRKSWWHLLTRVEWVEVDTLKNIIKLSRSWQVACSSSRHSVWCLRGPLVRTWEWGRPCCLLPFCIPFPPPLRLFPFPSCSFFLFFGTFYTVTLLVCWSLGFKKNLHPQTFSTHSMSLRCSSDTVGTACPQNPPHGLCSNPCMHLCHWVLLSKMKC